MATLAEIRQKYPDYDDMSDKQLSDAIYTKHYSDMPRDVFNQKIGYTPDASQGSDISANNVVRSLATGVPIIGGALNKMDAATNAGLSYVLNPMFDDKDQLHGSFGDRYSSALSQQSGMDKSFHDEHPYADTGLQVAGGMAAMAPAIAAAPAMFGAGEGGVFANSLVSAGTGALTGGADAGVRSDFDPSAMLEGVKWGGGLGLAGPSVGQAIGKGVSALTNRIGGPSQAQRLLAEAADADGIQDLHGKLSQMGPDAMPMDLGPNLQAQAEVLAGTPGKAQETVRSAITDRQAGAGQRITSALNDTLGESVDTSALAEDIIARRSAAAKPLYDAAYAKPVPFTKELEGLLSRPMVRSALKKAQGLAADEGIPSHQWFANIADDGKMTIKNVPDVRQLDLTKRALDDIISSSISSGKNNEARIYMQQRDLLTGMVDKAVPEYAQARKAYSGPSAVLNALEDGRSIFKNQMTPNEIRTNLMKMGDAEREAYIQGGRAAVSDTMGTARNDALAARQLFDRGYNREKLGMLVGDDKSQGLISALEAEKAFTQSRDYVTGNSRTFARAQAAKAIEGGGGDNSVIHELLNRHYGSAASKLAGKVTSNIRDTAQQGVNQELAGYLTVKPGDNDALKGMIDGVRAAQRRGEINGRQALQIVINAQQQLNQKVNEAAIPPRVLGQAQREPLQITVHPNR